MEPFRIYGSGIFRAGSQFHHAYITELSALTLPHTHDFYEMFLILQGEIIHIVNGAETVVMAGELTLVRPEDNHRFARRRDASCLFVNLAFLSAVAYDAFRYLDNDFQRYLLRLPQPPCALASAEATERTLKIIRDVSALPEDAGVRKSALLKALLFELLTTFKFGEAENDAQVPHWLSELVGRMQSVENFTAGITALYALAQRTPEHLARSFRKYMSTTPTQYINDLRLNYIKNMLVDTDIGIAEICLMAGFNSISHANHLFREKYGTPPSAYREEHRKLVVP